MYVEPKERYILRLEPNDEISPHFKAREFFQHESRDRYVIPPMKYFDRVLRLATILELVREHVDCPIKITSGYRTSARNKSTPGSALRSWHMFGCAVDFRAFVPRNIRQENAITEEMFGWLKERVDRLLIGGLGWYPVPGPENSDAPDAKTRTQQRIHMDIRPRLTTTKCKHWVK